MIMGLECTLTIRDLQGEPPGVQCPFRLEIIMIRTVEAVPSGGRGLLQYTGSVKQIAAAFQGLQSGQGRAAAVKIILCLPDGLPAQGHHAAGCKIMPSIPDRLPAGGG